MKVLVDFDNVSTALTRQGARYVADRILGAVAPVLGHELTNLDIRLYGGWDEKGALTTRAQKINAELVASFPRFTKTAHVAPPTTVRLSAMLAQSLECLPKKALSNTLRTASFEKQLYCNDPTNTVCPNARCPLSTTALFLTTGNCPTPGCNIVPAMLLKSTEQKLVDTMMVADLIYLADQKDPTVVIVSSDDDLWPGIMMAMIKGTHVIHVQTKGVVSASVYQRNVPGRYTQLGL